MLIRLQKPSSLVDSDEENYLVVSLVYMYNKLNTGDVFLLSLFFPPLLSFLPVNKWGPCSFTSCLFLYARFVLRWD